MTAHYLDRDAEIARLNRVVTQAIIERMDAITDRNNHQQEICHLQDRIADLKKLIDMQKATLDTQEKECHNFGCLEEHEQRITKLEECTYPGMAKDIGDLILRVDNMETALKALQEEVSYQNGAAFNRQSERD